ncbi:MAG: hypothetical protein JWQ56_1580, partial [Pseudarthrobacter sp.]|nr:hypothetical protein [Pseudarthrobacter sp.]
KLRRCEHSRRTGADDQDVNLVREFIWPVEADAGCRLYPRVSGYVTVVVKLHGIPHFVVWLGAKGYVFDNRIWVSI